MSSEIYYYLSGQFNKSSTSVRYNPKHLMHLSLMQIQTLQNGSKQLSLLLVSWLLVNCSSVTCSVHSLLAYSHWPILIPQSAANFSGNFLPIFICCNIYKPSNMYQCYSPAPYATKAICNWCVCILVKLFNVFVKLSFIVGVEFFWLPSVTDYTDFDTLIFYPVWAD